MIDTKELRRKINSTDTVDHIDLHASIRAILPILLDRLETTEDALREIAWSNDSKWQADRARSVLEESK